MADTATDWIQATKKPRNNRRALKQKNSSPNEAKIMVQKQPSPTPVPPPTNDENHETLSQPASFPKKAKATRASKAAKNQQKTSFEKELEEMQEMLKKMMIEKEKTEELLKETDEKLKVKEEELESKERELKKLQKMKEFKPTMTFPISKDMEQDKKEKKKKGGPEKKRPSPPYILWCKDQWNEVKKENPEAEFKDISNILGAKWKNVSAEEKKPYEERYQAEKEAYLQVMAKEKREGEAMKLFEEEHKQKSAMELLEQYLQFKQEGDKENKKTKKEKDPLKPKHPMPAFFLYLNERRAALAENKNVIEVAKIAGEEWKNMTEKEKEPYEEMGKKNKEKYMQEMEAYKQMKDDEANNLKKEEEELMKLQKQEALQLLKKKEKTENIIKKTKENRQKKKQQKGEKNTDPNKPKKPASSFLLFSIEARKTLMQERPGINSSTLSALISVKWKELNEEERQAWNAKAAEAMEAYKKEMEEYNKFVANTLSHNNDIPSVH
ncbi:HMG_box domain-containing protein [Cephalotus follicularis]|uniref:HMG_box domain-containing protein n=1 Tax=Cephalotus follicularis TaxID=3775 RepID=A0A1Q3B702_CEPFO|nr:HMG_box domain-containing protein [Cephalotus follicularis]